MTIPECLTKVIISNLADSPKFLPVIALWQHEQHLLQADSDASSDLLKRISYLQAHLNRDKALPLTLVAHVDDQLLGCASLVTYGRHSYNAWLTNVYVAPEHRGHGLGKKLIDHALIKAGQYQMQSVQLYTQQQCNFYRKLGWENNGTAKIRNGLVDILKYDLPETHFPITEELSTSQELPTSLSVAI